MKKSYYVKLSLLLLVLFLSACATKQAEAPKRVFWPMLPDKPYFEWIDVYYSENDLPQKGFEKALKSITGEVKGHFFGRPFGIASRGDGRIYVSDPDLSQVKIFNLNDSTVKLLGDDQELAIVRPLGMALDDSGKLYVADAATNKVWVFSAQDRFLYVFGNSKEMERPSYIAINDALDRVYVSDGKSSKIFVHNRAGDFLFSFGRYGGRDGEFIAPQGMAIDSQNRLFVADMNNARIQVFDAEGRFLYMFGVRGDKMYNFESPKDLAFDSDGNLHILDIRKAAILSYSPQGDLLLYLGGQASMSPVGFMMPTSVWIDKNDRMYIADQFARRFAVWQYLNKDYLKQHPIEVK